jgi:hypothetical protein
MVYKTMGKAKMRSLASPITTSFTDKNVFLSWEPLLLLGKDCLLKDFLPCRNRRIPEKCDVVGARDGVIFQPGTEPWNCPLSGSWSSKNRR